jgi:hypothetical protein
LANAWLRAAGISISDEDVLLELKTGAWAALVQALVWRKSAASRAAQDGLEVSEEDVDVALGDFYLERDLLEDAQASAWREEKRLDEASLRRALREACLARRLRERMAPDAAVEARFRANPLSYARIDVEVFAFPSEGAAREFALAVREGEVDAGRGELRQLRAAAAPQEIAALLFAAGEGELVGPVETDDGTLEVYRVGRRAEARLDAALREAIRDEMLQEALVPALARDPMSFQA